MELNNQEEMRSMVAAFLENAGDHAHIVLFPNCTREFRSYVCHTRYKALRDRLQQWQALPDDQQEVHVIQGWAELAATGPDSSAIRQLPLAEIAWLAAQVQWVTSQWKTTFVDADGTRAAHWSVTYTRQHEVLPLEEDGEITPEAHLSSVRDLYLHFVGLTKEEKDQIEEEIQQQMAEGQEQE